MQILSATQARGTRRACFGSQLREAPGRPSSLRPMPSRASEDAIHARSLFSTLPVRQEALFTHGVCFFALRYGKCHGQSKIGWNIDADFERNAGPRYAARLLRVAAAGGYGKALLATPDAFPCVRRRYLRTELVFDASRASGSPFYAQSLFLRVKIRQMPWPIKNMKEYECCL